MTTEDRLEKLEQKVARGDRRRRLALAGMGIVVLACAVSWVVIRATGLAQAQEQVSETVRAREFFLEDVNGVVRARLYVEIDDDAPTMRLLDGSGKGRAWLTVTEEGPRLRLFDEKGKFRVGLGVFEYGSGLGLFDEKGKLRAELVVLKAGPMLRMYDEKGKVTWQAP